MLRVYLNGSLVDLYQDESVNLTLQFTDIQNINATAGSFSQTFRIPATQNNLDILGQVPSTTAVGINLKTRIPAELVDNTIPIVRGFCQVKQVYLQKEKYADIELVFFGGAVDLKSAIGDGMLSDLDLSAADHELNLGNIQDSWGSVSPYPFDGTIRYGLLDKGFNWSFPDNPPWTAQDGIWQGELTPYIQVKGLLDTIMDEAGFTYESTFLNTTGGGNFSAMYLPAYNGNQTLSSVDFLDNTMAAGITANITGAQTLRKMLIYDTIAGGKDPEDNWTNAVGGGLGHRYTAPYTGYYSVKVRTVYARQGSGNTHIKIYLYKNGSLLETLVDDQLFYNQEKFLDHVFDGSGIGTGLSGPAILLESGDYLEVWYETSGSASRIYALSPATSTGGIGNVWTTSFEVFDTSQALSGMDVDMALNMPKMKQIDFVLGLQRMFNLVFVPDKNKPNHLLIEPFTDYTSTGTAKDWSYKVDYSKDVTIQPTTDLQKKEYKWTYQAGTDFISDTIQKSLGRVYGDYEVTDPGNDFATGEQTVETTFGQYMTSVIPGSSFAIHRSLLSDGTGVKDPLPMIAYWHGLSERFGNWYTRTDLGVTTAASSYFPSFSNYSTDYADIGDKDLNFGSEQPFIPVDLSPWRTLYFQYWAQYVNELYSEEARIMKCTMRLSKGDLAAFEFSDRIYIRDSYWRVLKLSYDANVEGVCQVELIKELSDVAVCADTPTGYDDRYNFILFNSSTSGSPDFGSEECCKLYGYDWVTIPVGVPGGTSPMGICKPKNQTTQPQ